MSKFPRRTFIAGLSTIPFALWLEKYAAAAPPMIRYNVTSVKGQKMLKIYRDTVGTMMSTPEPSPIGWLFQWYTHNVRSDRTKAGELARVYPAPSAQKTLATAMWNTCQAHHAGDVEDYFLPWHRMYVYFLERIIRKVSGHAESSRCPIGTIRIRQSLQVHECRRRLERRPRRPTLCFARIATRALTPDLRSIRAIRAPSI
jgi:hypothetical protein